MNEGITPIGPGPPMTAFCTFHERMVLNLASRRSSRAVLALLSLTAAPSSPSAGAGRSPAFTSASATFCTSLGTTDSSTKQYMASCTFSSFQSSASTSWKSSRAVATARLRTSCPTTATAKKTSGATKTAMGSPLLVLRATLSAIVNTFTRTRCAAAGSADPALFAAWPATKLAKDPLSVAFPPSVENPFQSVFDGRRIVHARSTLLCVPGPNFPDTMASSLPASCRGLNPRPNRSIPCAPCTPCVRQH
mmetsp:Transcript_669/g.2370  ORF Transcript_669/g.2370 Transcript_669/m.2370 type:complete len:249 (+) Transcript_669:1841-2587(+)